jgi:hypothetical protein
MGVYIKSRFTYDPDALAFIQASSIPNTSQKLAINKLVLDLKAYGIWGKMRAIYPMIGGSAFYHKWNLKDPRDLDAAFRLNFVGGWTHSSTGAKPNGTNAYANTYFSPSANLSAISTHLSYYSRTDVNLTEVEIGSQSVNAYTIIEARTANTSYFLINTNTITGVSDTNSAAFYIGNRTGSFVTNGFRNNIKIFNSSSSASALPPNNIYIGALHNASATPQYYSTKECAFATIGDGLTDTEAANFYTAVQAFQVALGRSIGTQTVSDADAQAFVNAAVIEDQVQATAINQLVIDMKGYGLWSKMKAVYPFVGGTATSHKWNLKNPLDTNAAFRLSFVGGWTHTAQGAQANGTNGYGDTFLIPNTAFSVADNIHLSVYSRTDQSPSPTDIEMGTYDGNTASLLYLSLDRQFSPTGTNGNLNNATNISFTDTNSAAFYIASRIGSTQKIFRNFVAGVTFSNATGALATTKIAIANAFSAAYGGAPDAGLYSNKQYAFMSIGDGLTDTEANNFYTVVQNFNTTLNRQVV